MWVPCGIALAFSVNSSCPSKMTILRLCYCGAVCQLSSFVSEACNAASAPSAFVCVCGTDVGLDGRLRVSEAIGTLGVVESTL